MSHNIVLAAQQFSAHHFCNIYMNQDQFAHSIREALQDFSNKEDQVTFLQEVIRLGRTFLKSSQVVLEKMEATGIASMGISQLHFS